MLTAWIDLSPNFSNCNVLESTFQFLKFIISVHIYPIATSRLLYILASSLFKIHNIIYGRTNSIPYSLSGHVQNETPKENTLNHCALILLILSSDMSVGRHWNPPPSPPAIIHSSNRILLSLQFGVVLHTGWRGECGIYIVITVFCWTFQYELPHSVRNASSPSHPQAIPRSSTKTPKKIAKEEQETFVVVWCTFKKRDQEES